MHQLSIALVTIKIHIHIDVMYTSVDALKKISREVCTGMLKSLRSETCRNIVIHAPVSHRNQSQSQSHCSSASVVVLVAVVRVRVVRVVAVTDVADEVDVDDIAARRHTWCFMHKCQCVHRVDITKTVHSLVLVV